MCLVHSASFKMFKLIVLAFVFAVAGGQRSFIHKCSLQDPNIDQCFVRNGNLAIEILNQGHEELELANLNGFDFGDLFLGLSNDLSFLLEDIKGFLKGLTLLNAHLHFDSHKALRRVDLSLSVYDAVWFGKYRALGFIDNHKVNEKGKAQIEFGNVTINYTLDFKRKTIDGVNYLKARNHGSSGQHERFEFKSKDVINEGVHLRPEQFQLLETPIIDKALQISVDYITFVFNQIFQELPEAEIFLP